MKSCNCNLLPKARPPNTPHWGWGLSSGFPGLTLSITGIPTPHRLATCRLAGAPCSHCAVGGRGQWLPLAGHPGIKGLCAGHALPWGVSRSLPASLSGPRRPALQATVTLLQPPARPSVPPPCLGSHVPALWAALPPSPALLPCLPSARMLPPLSSGPFSQNTGAPKALPAPHGTDPRGPSPPAGAPTALPSRSHECPSLPAELG